MKTRKQIIEEIVSCFIREGKCCPCAGDDSGDTSKLVKAGGSVSAYSAEREKNTQKTNQLLSKLDKSTAD